MSWQIRRYGALEVYQSTLLNQAERVGQAFSTKGWGNLALHTQDRAADVISCRRQFLSSQGWRLSQLVAAAQVHGNAVQVVEPAMAGAGAETLATQIPATDALITQVPGVALAVFTADCLPLFFYDPQKPAVAVVHAGWRGAIGGIVERVLEKMAKHYQTRPAKLRAAIGPAICKKCFQVQRDLADIFDKADSESVVADATGYFVDLPGFITRILQKAGVAAESVSRTEVCTSCRRETFFSYRANPGTPGRMMGIIGLP
jgi:YfiH family protein